MDPQQIVRDFNEAINGRDLDRLTSMLTDDHRFVDSAGQIVSGREAVAAAWSGFFASFPDYRNEFDTVEARGDAVVVAGRSICCYPDLHGPALWTARVIGDRVAEWRVYEDTPEQRAALGLG
jgi:ketosteroid isomerase-like protein